MVMVHQFWEECRLACIAGVRSHANNPGSTRLLVCLFMFLYPFFNPSLIYLFVPVRKALT